MTFELDFDPSKYLVFHEENSIILSLYSQRWCSRKVGTLNVESQNVELENRQNCTVGTHLNSSSCENTCYTYVILCIWFLSVGLYVILCNPIYYYLFTTKQVNFLRLSYNMKFSNPLAIVLYLFSF